MIADHASSILKPIELSVAMGGSGAYPHIGPWPPSFVKRAVAQNIAAAAYEEPLTAAEISQRIGIPVDFVQEEVDTLVDHELMCQVGNRYQTDFVILRYAAYKALDAALSRVGDSIAAPLLQSMYESRVHLHDIGFYESSQSYNEQLWTFIPFTFKEAHKQTVIPAAGTIGVFPERKDGGHWLVHGFETQEIKSCSISQNMCGGYKGKVILTVYMVSNVCENVQYRGIPGADSVELMYDLVNNASDGPTLSDDRCELADRLVTRRLLRRDGDALKLNTLYMDRAQYNALCQLTGHILDGFATQTSVLREQISSILKSVIPAHLAWQVDHYADVLSANVGGYVMRAALQQGYLSPPEDLATAGTFLLERSK